MGKKTRMHRQVLACTTGMALLAVGGVVAAEQPERGAALTAAEGDRDALPGADEEESSALATLLLSVGNGVATGAAREVGGEVAGWTMTSLGLTSDPDAEIVAALEEIEQTLEAIEGDLADIEVLLEQQSCQNAANVDHVQNALDAIDDWVGRGSSPAGGSYRSLSMDAQKGVDITAAIPTLFDKVLNGYGNFSRLEDLLVGLDNALRDQGNAEQLISACGLLVEPPTDQWDDRVYFQQLANLVGFYAEYQARAAVVVTEAYHWKALEAWLAAGNDPASLAPEDVPSICDAPTGDVLTYCVRAADAYDNIRTNLRAQYGEAGAPYSSGTPADPEAPFVWDANEPVVQIDNTSGYVWVKDIDDFFEHGGYSTTCRASTSASPCGPGVGDYDHTTFENYQSAESVLYGANGGYNTWSPATIEAWEALTPTWSGSSTTFAQLMEDTHGFSGATTPRVYFTGESTTADYEYRRANAFYIDLLEVACFVVTPMNKGNAEQPFCSSHIGNLVTTGGDHEESNHPCWTIENETHGTLDGAGIESPFFAFLFNVQNYDCASGGHPNGWTFYPGPPGWLLEYEAFTKELDPPPDVSSGVVSVPRSSYDSQYHWPAFDGAGVTCTAEPATGHTRSPLALNGRTTVPKLCGDDFDAWFEKWVSPDATVQAAPVLITPAEVAVELPPGSTAGLAHHEVTATVDYAHLVSALDAGGGSLVVSCFPGSGQAFQLGTTSLRCSATDGDGRTSTERVDVHVRYPFRFAGHLERSAKRVRAGRTVTVAFTLGGDRGPDAVQSGDVTSTPLDCETGEPIGEAEVADRALRYRPGPQRYRFIWQTQRAWDGQCRTLDVPLVDGTRHSARFEFRGKGGGARGGATP